MHALIAVVLLAFVPFSPSLAAGNADSIQIAQVTKPAANKVVPPSKAPATEPSCVMDGRIALDKETWCRKSTLYQCNASSGQWTTTGKRCP